MTYRLVVWDFDGTLADTLPAALSTFNVLAARHGFLPVEDPESTRGLTSRAFMKKHRVPLMKLPRLTLEFIAAQKDHMASARLCSGLPEVLASLRERGLRQGIVSSNARDNILACLRANECCDAFDFVVGSQRLFGKARAIRKALRTERVAPGEVLYVGDEVRDIQAARKAGVAIASVTWGLNAASVLSRNSPDHLIFQPEQLCDLLLA